MKKALITGITGQDGSYLAELLLQKGYEVFGIIRRSSSFNTARIDDIYQDPHEAGVRLRLVYGDLNDASSLNRILRTVKPDEIYNLGAQSHVRVSFDVPEYTAEVTGVGTVRLLEAIRESGQNPKFYQASSSELFGSSAAPQSEKTPFHPRSPYGVAKLYSYWITVNYRESYNMYACNGILFNHECISARTPIVVRRSDIIDVLTVDELVSLRHKGSNVQQFEPSEPIEVWDGAGWTPIRAITATRRRSPDPEHRILSIEARGGIAEVTAHHHMLDADLGELPADQVADGQRLALAQRFPAPTGWTVVSPELAEFLGLMTAEGYVPAERGTLQFTNNDQALRDRVAHLWRTLFLGASRTDFYPSGFDPSRRVGQLYLTGANSLCEWLRNQLYTENGFKRVPPLVLNATPDIQRIFLAGYYEGDGLKAGNGESVKTNSPVLAQGLCWLYGTTGRLPSVYVEHRDGRDYYQLNLPSEHPQGDKGAHLRKDPAEVRRVVESAIPSEWVFDLETESGRFCAGVGRLVVHNSPRRGETFVSRKITRAAARIKLGMQDKLFLGNLDAKRDWGYAGDYVEAMWLMLQQDKPDDFVIATGECHTVRDFLDEAFGYLSIDWKSHVEIDPRYYRPAEVDELRGDMTKARKLLKWEPKVKFRDLVQMMVKADLEDVTVHGDQRRDQQ
jgi:GDPmannose 4,6-dehydratase